MSKIDTISLIDLSHCLQRAEALVQILHQITNSNGDHNQLLMIEIIEEYLLRARKVIGD